MKRNNERTEIEGVRKLKDSLCSQGGAFRTGAAIKAGVHPRTHYTLRDQGVIERLGRGMYLFADMPTLGNPDLTTPNAGLAAFRRHPLQSLARNLQKGGTEKPGNPVIPASAPQLGGQEILQWAAT
jgi:hypothetical protein